jgi:hypothetical protein
MQEREWEQAPSEPIRNPLTELKKRIRAAVAEEERAAQGKEKETIA